METKEKKEVSNMWIGIIAATVFTLVLFAGMFVIEYLSPAETNSLTLDCIAENSNLYVATGCSFCNSQKQLLGEDLTIFNIVDCRNNPEVCINIKVVLTWVINNETYEGYHTIEDLKEISGC